MKHPRLLEGDELQVRADIPELWRGGDFEVVKHERVPSGDDGPDFLVLELAFASEFEIDRWGAWESVEMTTSAADLSRVEQGVCPVVFNHTDDQIGVVESVTFGSDRRARARVRFSRGASAHDVVQDIVDGIRKGVSYGYKVLEMELRSRKDDGDHYRVTRWQMWELTFAPMPLDPTVGSHRAETGEASSAIIRRALEDGGKVVDLVRAFNTETRQWVEVDPSLIDGKLYQRALAAPEPAEPPAPAATPPAPASPEGIQVRGDRTTPSAGDDGSRDDERKRVRDVRDVSKRFKASEELETRALSEGWDAQRLFAGIQLERAHAGDLEPIVPPSTELGLSSKEVGEYSIVRAMETLAKRGAGKSPESSLELEMSEAIAKQLGEDPKGAFVPYDVLVRSAWGPNPAEDASRAGMRQRAVSTTTPAGGPGSNIIETELRAGSFIELLVNRTLAGALGVTIIPGLRGNVDFPKETGGITPGWVAEGAGSGSSDPQLGKVSMSPKTIRARTDMTRRMRLQSTPAIEGIVRNGLIRDVGIHVDAAVFDGAGGNAPTGIRSQSGVNSVTYTTSNGLTEFQSIIAMETAIANANADIGTFAYATTPSVRGRLKSTFVGTLATMPAIWTGRGSDGELNGYRAAVSNNLPRTLGAGTDEHSLFAGVFSECMVGEWGVLDIMPDDITLADSGGLAIRAFQDIDVALRHAQAFAHTQLIP